MEILFCWVSLDKDIIKPSVLPLAKSSILITSLSKDSSDKQTITLYPFSLATCSIPLITVAKKW